MKNLTPQFDFDDILIVPDVTTEITSRYKNIELPSTLPLFTAPMDTVVNLNNVDEFLLNGINVCLPRTIKNHVFVSEMLPGVFISLGFEDIDKMLTDKFRDLHGANPHILIDVANGHMTKIVDYCKKIKSMRPDITIMVGNIANPETYRWYAEQQCVDYIRVGIGNGCFAKGSRILMGSGFYKNIEDVVDGDEVINMNGKICAVKRLIRQGKKKVVSLKTSMSPRETIVTPDHNYFVGNYNVHNKDTKGYSKSLKNYSWSEIGCFNNDITPLFPKAITFNTKESFCYDLKDFAVLKSTTNKYKTLVQSNYNVGYVLGTYLGDGNSRIRHTLRKGKYGLINTTTGSVTWSFNINERNIVEKLKNCLYEEFGLTPKEKIEKNVIRVFLYCKPLAHLLCEFGKRQNKHLPDKYFVNNYKYLQGICDGLIDSDGNISENRKSFFNTSLCLVELYNIINYLLLGSLPNSAMRGNNVSKLIKNSSKGYSSRNFLEPNKRETLDNKYIINKIISVNHLEGEFEVFDLEIDDDTHSFIVDNCIVHNSGCLTTKQSGVGYPMASLIHNTYAVKQELINLQDPTKPWNWRKTQREEFSPIKNFPAIVADGGMKDYSDIIKALALGCFLPNSLVYTSNGFKKIKNINIGDEVYTHTSEYKRVVNKFKYKNNKDIISVNGVYSTNNHHYYVVHKKHKNVLSKTNIGDYAEWIAAEDLTSEYLLVEKETCLLHRLQVLLSNIFGRVFIKKYLREKETNKPID